METYFSMISEFSANMGGPAKQISESFSRIWFKGFRIRARVRTATVALVRGHLNQR